MARIVFIGTQFFNREYVFLIDLYAWTWQTFFHLSSVLSNLNHLLIRFSAAEVARSANSLTYLQELRRWVNHFDMMAIIMTFLKESCDFN